MLLLKRFTNLFLQIWLQCQLKASHISSKIYSLLTYKGFNLLSWLQTGAIDDAMGDSYYTLFLTRLQMEISLSTNETEAIPLTLEVVHKVHLSLMNYKTL